MGDVETGLHCDDVDHRHQHTQRQSQLAADSAGLYEISKSTLEVLISLDSKPVPCKVSLWRRQSNRIPSGKAECQST